MIKMTDRYFCPYCGSVDILQKFLIKKKSGGYSKNLKCPSCNNVFRLKTLKALDTFWKWGYYIYFGIRYYNNKSGYDDFHSKVNFASIIENIRIEFGEWGVQDFWDGYMTAKQQYGKLSYWDMHQKIFKPPPKQLKLIT